MCRIPCFRLHHETLSNILIFENLISEKKISNVFQMYFQMYFSSWIKLNICLYTSETCVFSFLWADYSENQNHPPSYTAWTWDETTPTHIYTPYNRSVDSTDFTIPLSSLTLLYYSKTCLSRLITWLSITETSWKLHLFYNKNHQHFKF